MSNNDTLSLLPPQNIEAEQSVLGSLLIDKNALVKIADILEPKDFYTEKHGMIFASMLDLYEKKEPIDLLSLGNRLKEKKQLEEIGGKSYLIKLARLTPTSAHIVIYAKIVQKKATLRKLINAATEISELGHQEEVEDISQLLDKAESLLFGVSQKYLKQNFIPIQNILTEAFDRIDELHKQKGKLRGLPTGFSDLDNILAGLQKSDLIILAARPSMGKTALALDIALNVARTTKIPVGIFSLEMSQDQLVDRLICSQANVDLWRMRTGRLSEKEDDDDFPKIGHAMAVLSEAPIFIDDSATVNIMEIRTKCRRLQAEHGLGLIILDYLQLMEGRKNENRVQEVAEITRSLKGIARELNIPVLALSQLNRAVESRTPPIPKLSDLRESGTIEQDADVVMFIYREDIYKQESHKKNIAEIYIAKHRNGPTGKIELFFDERKVSFRNLEKTIQEE
ncbi:replicative DNA helicase [Candidatus Kuenenbacteria bacterium]|nr:replicative DNA helicase [Candidatus Kuenenbacteria bacterium]